MLINRDLKLGVGHREQAANKEELRSPIIEHMELTKVNPEKVKPSSPSQVLEMPQIAMFDCRSNNHNLYILGVILKKMIFNIICLFECLSVYITHIVRSMTDQVVWLLNAYGL